MKRTGGLWPEVISFANLYEGYCKARKGKRDRPQVADFSLNLETELFELQASLNDGSYFPSIDHQILKAQLRTKIKDRRAIALLDLIIDGSPDVKMEPCYFPGDGLFSLAKGLLPDGCKSDAGRIRN